MGKFAAVRCPGDMVAGVTWIVWDLAILAFAVTTCVLVLL